VGELKKAFSGSGIHFGVYYSLYEWFNPLYLENPSRYSVEHHFPQFKDLVTSYKPEIIFADGEWSHDDSVWRSNELIAWLYNESPVRNSVVINDRWFKGCRHRHGDYYTTEYGSGLEGVRHPWEENRAISKSYAYNRMEKAADYSTPRELILMLADIVSRGGNLLLDVGPSADGRIPEIMEDRLENIGEWLQVNGEAIFDTVPWKQSCQWSQGHIADAERGEFKTGYDILRLTLSPEPGDAVKEIFFTSRNSSIYAITPRFPRDTLLVKNINLPPGSEIILLGSDSSLVWKNEDENLRVDVPPVTPDELPCRYSWVFKISPATGL
jgi:alpha-L-fucosidase